VAKERNSVGAAQLCTLARFLHRGGIVVTVRCSSDFTNPESPEFSATFETYPLPGI
jgi:hypothetical protein